MIPNRDMAKRSQNLGVKFLDPYDDSFKRGHRLGLLKGLAIAVIPTALLFFTLLS